MGNPDNALRKAGGSASVRIALETSVLLAAATLCVSLQAQPSEDLPFATARATFAATPLERIYDGTVEAVNQATVSAQTAGRIAEISYDVNDYVEAGEPLIRFTNVEQQAALRQAQAALDEALARARQAEDEFARASSLLENGLGTRRDFDLAQAARDASAASVEAARSALSAAEQQAEYTLVRAPYAGIVTERHVEVGESVTIGQPLMSGLSLEALRVAVDLPQNIAAEVRQHRAAAVLTEEGRVTPTEMTIFPFADPATNSFTVRVELPEGQFGLYPGMFVKVAFVVGESQRLLIPSAALMRRSEVTGVYVVAARGAVRLRQVRVGSDFGDRVEVLAGLDADEQVALDPVAAGIYAKAIAARGND